MTAGRTGEKFFKVPITTSNSAVCASLYAKKAITFAYDRPDGSIKITVEWGENLKKVKGMFQPFAKKNNRDQRRRDDNNGGRSPRNGGRGGFQSQANK